MLNNINNYTERIASLLMLLNMNIKQTGFSVPIGRIRRIVQRLLGNYVFSKYWAIVLKTRKSESDLALGLIECMNTTGGNPKVLMTDGKGAIKTNNFFSKLNRYPKLYTSLQNSANFTKLVYTIVQKLYTTSQDSATLNTI